MNKKTVLTIGVLFALAIILSVIAYQFARMNTAKQLTQTADQTAEQTVVSPKPKFSLIFLTENPTVAIGQTANITLSTGTVINGLTAGSFEIKFDPAAIEILAIEDGTLWSDFNVLEKTINNEKGTIRYSAGKGFGLKEDTIGTTIISFQYKAKQTGVTTVSLQPTTKLVRTSSGGQLETDISTLTITIE